MMGSGVNDSGQLTCVSASATVTNGVAIDLPSNIALAIIVVYGRINGAALIERADQWLVADRLIRTGHAARLCDADAVFGGVLYCRSAVVHHVATVILSW
jgi:hypothetical protein